MISRLLENIWLTIQQVRGSDLVDMILVWIVVYRVLLLIKQTRAVQVLSGLGILSITFILSVSFELSTINWLLDKFFGNLFVIVAILFQNEIRKALAHIGRNPFFAGVSSAEETQVLDEIAKSAIMLAQKRLGALIVLEREIALDDFIEVGTPLDCAVSAEVLNAIFLQASPLHDGAVIVRQGRLHSAGSFLPLTKNPNVGKSLGTRHRAAIGLTEETDSVVLVVSEENNQVGLVIGGELKSDVDLPTLRQMLYNQFNLQDKYSRGTERGVAL